jgi:tRNA(fMet)-specific endonuclease VapC
MAGKYLLDTNIVIALFGDDRTVKGRLADTEVLVPCIVVGELHYGARKSRQVEENIARIDDFVSENVVLECNDGTARQYGEVKDRLRRKGHPIPENDIWIAALALQHGLTLVSRDEHFEQVQGLQKEMW